MNSHANEYSFSLNVPGRGCFSLADNSNVSREGACARCQDDSACDPGFAACAEDCFMDPNEVAEYLRISRSTVYKLIERRQIPSVKIGRSVRISKSELDAVLSVNGRPAVR